MTDLAKDHPGPFRRSIRRRLTIWGLVLLGAALVMNTVAGSLYTRGQIRRSNAELQAEIASATAKQIHFLVTRKLERLEDTALAMSPYAAGGQEQKLRGVLLLSHDRSFGEFTILDPHGMELVKSSERKLYLPSDLQDQSSSAAFLKAIGGQSYIGPVRTTDEAEPYVSMAVPLKRGAQNIVGVLTAEANLKFLWEIIGRSRFAHGGYAYVVNSEGIVIAHGDSSLVLKRLSLRHLPKVRDFMLTRSADAAPAQQGPGINGQPVLNTYALVPQLDWAVIVEEPVELALADLRRMELFAIALVTFGLLIGGIIIIGVSQKITQPIQQLRKSVQTIAGGDLSHRSQVRAGDEIEELAEEFNKMTAALQNSYATLEQKVQQRTREVSALYEVSTIVNQSLDLDGVLDALNKKITQLFQFETTRIFLYDGRMQVLKLRASFQTHPEPWARVSTIKRGESAVGRVASTGDPLLFEDIQTDARYLALSTSKAAYQAGMRFLFVFPIKTQSQVFGAIAFSGKERRRLSEDEIRLLTSMSEHVGIAVEKARLFEQVKERSEHVGVLNTIGAAVSRSLDVDVVLREAVDKITQSLAYDACWIYVFDFTQQCFRLKAYKGLSAEVVQAMDPRPHAGGISGKIFATGEPLVFEDMRSDARYPQMSSGSKLGSMGFTSSAGFPIRAKDKAIGLLHVANKARRRLSPEELQLLQSIAQEIGVAVENARLFAEVNEKTRELSTANRDLLEATRAKSEFIAAMSHELRTPLNIIIGNADLTGDGFFGDLNVEQKDALRKVSRNARVLLKMINDVLALSRLEAKKMSLDLSTVEISEIIAHARTHVEQINRDNRLEVTWEVDSNLPSLFTDSIKLEEILQNLIGNAFKYTPQGRIAVQVRKLCDQDRVQFTITDTGIGIESENLGRIFNEFEQVQEAHTGAFNGVGLGLSIVKKYLQLMQGDIRVESTPGEGSTFIFSLPRSISAEQ